MIKLILNNSFLNGVSSHILSRKSKILKPVLILFLIALSLVFFALESLIARINPQRMRFKKDNHISPVHAAH
jgi:hypothetical protein